MEETIVRQNLLKDKNYRPYCGSDKSCSMPRTEYRTYDSQFICPECKWISSFPADFIEKYKQTHFPMETKQNTETKKQEAIRLAYEDKWHTVKESVNPDNGWCTNELFQDDDGEIIVCPCCKHIFNQSKIVYCINSLERCPNCNGHVSQYEYHHSFINVPEDAQKRFGEWRPKSLSGIEDNRGWISILSEEDLPKEDLEYRVGKLHNRKFYLSRGEHDKHEVKAFYVEDKITHYQPIQKPQPPIF